MLIWFITKSTILMFISIYSIMWLFLMQNPVIMNYSLNCWTELPVGITILIDEQSLIFMSTVSMVSSMVVVYSYYYMMSESVYSMKKFIMVLLVFIVSMMLLSISANLFWLMVGWDGLGISSLFLIIFYQNWKSFSSGMVTFMSNRVGDTLIIISMIWMVINSSIQSWTLLSGSLIMSLVLSIGAFSKSAQLPYLFWLPQAMAAPTPVSALVHSSTLVTAGVYMICRFHSFLNKSIIITIFFISLITVIIAGTSSLFEFDIKKIIALSTLCHISLMMMFSILEEKKMSLFHFSTHAFFKSLLFMAAGYLIHSNMNNQDIRFISMSNLDIKISIPIYISLTSMMGFPLMSGFYSKEALLMKSTMDLPSLMMIMGFLINSLFSCAYSMRLVYYLTLNSTSFNHLHKKDGFSTILLFSSFLGSFSGGLIMLSMTPEEEMVQSQTIKTFLFLCCMLGMIIGVISNKIVNFNNLMIHSFMEFWKSNFIYKIFQNHFFLASSLLMWISDEKGMVKASFKLTYEKMMMLSYFFSNILLKMPLSSIKTFHFSILSMMLLI